MKAELSTRVQAATGTTVDPEIYRVGWTTIKIEGTGEVTHAIAILAKPELHSTLEPLFMEMANENSTQTSTRDYSPYPVGLNQEYNSQRLRSMMRQQKIILGDRTGVILVGIPAGVGKILLANSTRSTGRGNHSHSGVSSMTRGE